LQTYAKSKYSLSKLNSGISKLSQNSTPHSGIGDISKMSHPEINKKFGDKTASKLYSHNAINDYMGNRYGLNPTGANTIPEVKASNIVTNPPYTNPALDNRKFEIDPNTLNAREVGTNTTMASLSSSRFKQARNGNFENILPRQNNSNNSEKLSHIKNNLSSNTAGRNSVASKGSSLNPRLPRQNNFKQGKDSSLLQAKPQTRVLNAQPRKETLNGNI
jgi:hypothetical protein